MCVNLVARLFADMMPVFLAQIAKKRRGIGFLRFPFAATWSTWFAKHPGDNSGYSGQRLKRIYDFFSIRVEELTRLFGFFRADFR